MLPKITIITPSYNQAPYLEQAIVSVIDQNYSNLEYIIIDGASTDDSIRIIKKYENHISYWISEKDNGQSHAINKGLRKATGDIIAWLNSDDQYLPHALAKVADIFIRNPEIYLLHGRTILFGDSIKEKIKGALNHDLFFRYLAYMPFPQPSSFFKKNILLEQGYLDELLHYGMDYDLLVRIALNYPIGNTDEVLSKYRIHAFCKTNQHEEIAKDWARVFSKVLRSFNFTSPMIDQLKCLNLYFNAFDHYPVTINYSKGDLEKALLYFLEIQLHYYYECLDLKKSTEIALMLKQLNPNFYKREKIGKIYLKSKIFTKPVVYIMRKFTR